MRLLKRHIEGGLCLTEDFYEAIPPYAILSHTWGAADEEVSYQDIQEEVDRRLTGAHDPPAYAHKSGLDKIDFCLAQAAADGIAHVWIDTCCIDKRNAVELNKAINSMFRWYQRAERCYVFLPDVSAPKSDALSVPWWPAFRNSRWFTRGWTLQELIAPTALYFYSVERSLLGNRQELAPLIHEITGIPLPALSGSKLSTFSVEDRFAWASSRTTKEPEDRVYSLVGLLEISLAQNYGEGEENALVRLKAALAERYHDRLSTMSRRQNSHDQSTAPQAAKVWRGSDAAMRGSSIPAMLGFRYNGNRRSTIRPPTARTCEWILEHALYQKWLDPSQLSGHHGLLWIKGKPGAGKSTLLKFLDLKACEQSSTAHSTVVSFYFNARGAELEKTAEGMYRSLICQLIDLHPECDDKAQALMNSQGRRLQSSSWSNADLQYVLSALIRHLHHKRLVVFVDALDECRAEEIQGLIEFFEDLTDDQSSGSGEQLLVCLSIRHYPTVTIGYGLELVLDAEAGHLFDIETHASRRLRVGTDDRAEAIKAELIRKSNGLFIWTVLVIDILNAEYRTGRSEALLSRLQQIPEDLDTLYHSLVAKDRAQADDFLVCLQWLLFAARPLDVRELYTAIKLSKSRAEDSNHRATEINPDEMKKFVLNASKGLAEVHEIGTVQFIHESAQDFLLNARGLQNLLPPGTQCVWCQSHLLIRDTCESAIAAQSSRLARYATLYLALHAEEALEHESQDRFIAHLDFEALIRAIRKNPGRGPIPRSLLHWLAEVNAPGLIDSAVRVGRDKEYLASRHSSPILTAVSCESIESLGTLLAHGADVDACDEDGQTALMLACEDCNELAVIALVHNGANVQAHSNEGSTALMYALSSYNPNRSTIARLLIEACALFGSSEVDFEITHALAGDLPDGPEKEQILDLIVYWVSVNDQGQASAGDSMSI